jgi:hypothetical protein
LGNKGVFMAFDYELEEKKFSRELDDGSFKIERIPNTGIDYPGEKEDRDVKAYETYLASDSFKTLNAEAAK